MPQTPKGIYYADNNTDMNIAAITAAMATSIDQNLPIDKIAFGSIATKASTTGTTYIDSGLTATITPSSATNKILVLAFVPYYSTSTVTAGTAGGVDFAINRDGTNIHLSSQRIVGPANAGTAGVWSAVFLDEPASTSTLVYKVRFKAPTTLNNSRVNSTLDADTKSTMVLVELVA